MKNAARAAPGVTLSQAERRDFALERLTQALCRSTAGLC